MQTQQNFGKSFITFSSLVNKLNELGTDCYWCLNLRETEFYVPLQVILYEEFPVTGILSKKSINKIVGIASADYFLERVKSYVKHEGCFELYFAKLITTGIQDESSGGVRKNLLKKLKHRIQTNPETGNRLLVAGTESQYNSCKSDI